jgi:hypothetical protein
MSKQFLSLDYAEIKDKFPLSQREIAEWFTKKSGELSEIRPADVERVVAAVVQFSPRNLYDAFDDLGCRIYITDHQSSSLEPGGPPFYYYNSMNRASKVASTRKEAEAKAFMEAFEILEKTLADGKNQAGVQTSDRSI